MTNIKRDEIKILNNAIKNIEKKKVKNYFN